MTRYPHVGDPDHNFRTAFFELEYENVFHMKELYKRIHEWCEQWHYTAIDGIGQREELYMELMDSNGASNHHIWWRFERKENSYVKYFIKFDMQTLGLQKVEIMHEGKKFKTNKGNPIFRVEAWVMLDYKDEWKKHWLLKHFDEWFVKRWFKQQVDMHKRQLWFELYNLEEMMKQYLKLANTFDLPEPFHSPMGFPQS